MQMLKELYDYRAMVMSLIKKELRGKYKGSILGFLWTFINPLCQMLIYTIVFTYIMPQSIDKYYLFLFVALIPWIFFATSLTGGATCIWNQKGLVTKIYFPREVLPVSFVTSAFINMLLCFVIVFVVVIIAGVQLSVLALLCLPIVMIIEYFLALGIAFLSSSITVYFRDMEHILGVLSMIWMYLTPILYSIDRVPEEYRTLFYFNPMTSVVLAYRDILYYGQVPQMHNLLIAAAVAILLLIIGVLVFRKLKRHFAEEL